MLGMEASCTCTRKSLLQHVRGLTSKVGASDFSQLREEYSHDTSESISGAQRFFPRHPRKQPRGEALLDSGSTV